MPARPDLPPKGPTHLVIGGCGLIGTALCDELRDRGQDFVATTRRRDLVRGAMLHLDLADMAGDIDQLPRAEVVWLVAAMPKFAECEGNPTAWQVNVDAPIRLAQRFRHQCVIFLSSESVEWCPGAYARQKAQVEAFMQSITGIIVRPAKVAPERAGELAGLIVDAAERRVPGVIRWK